MQYSLIAQRYAKSVFDLALELKMEEAVKTDMELVLSVCRSNKDFMLLLTSPVIRTDKKEKILHTLFNDKVCELTMRFLNIITRKKREKYIGNIAEEYIQIYKKFKNIITVRFESAQPISDAIRKKIIRLMEEQTHGTIELIEDVKKELIGGFVLNYEGYKYDASIACQLQKLKKSAAETNLYIREI
jgi:F-type H+-transporting ATPase subunit delta